MPELPDLIGPAAALVLSLGMLYLFYTGRILARSTVPREEFVALRDINASYAAALEKLIEAVRALSVSVDRMNGSKR